MTYTSHDLQVDLHPLLAGLGYHVVGDDELGWAYTFGPDDSGRPVRDGLDTSAEAAELAMQDLTMCVTDLVDAGKDVVEQWETSKLAEAVRELSTAVAVLDPSRVRGMALRSDRSQLMRQLQRLLAKGLTFDDCVEVFGEKTTDSPVASLAKQRLQDEGRLEIDDHTVVSYSADGGAYVLAWIWQDFPEQPRG